MLAWLQFVEKWAAFCPLVSVAEQRDFPGSAGPVRGAGQPVSGSAMMQLFPILPCSEWLPSPPFPQARWPQHSQGCTQIRALAHGMQIQTSAFQESRQTFPGVPVKGGAQWHGQEARMESQNQQWLSGLGRLVNHFALVFHIYNQNNSLASSTSMF